MSPLASRDNVWQDYLHQIVQGREEALACLYDETSHIIYSLALRVLRNTADAEEVTLDVYKQVWRRAAEFTSARGSVLAWLTTMGRSRALDHWRRHSSEARGETSLDEMEAPQLAAAPAGAESLFRHQQHLVRSALARLSPDQREVLELTYFLGLSHSELARRIGQPLGTVKTRIRLGMMKLRELLGSAA